MPSHSEVKLIDHIGVDLFQTADAWKSRYAEEMVRRGYPHFAGAGSALLQFIGPKGARPADIARRMGVSRQAVQQLADTLEADGIVSRAPDPEDGRGKILRLTAKGAEAHWAGNIAKAEIEEEIIHVLGAEKAQTLKADLQTISHLLLRKSKP